jgi:heme-degrading monooxygenase HmoA
MIHIIWEFRVKPEWRREFEHHYSSGGSWAKFFQQGRGYRGTSLLRDTETSDTYLTVDRWDDVASYESFRAEHQEGYQRIDRECETLTESERHIGTFEEL